MKLTETVGESAPGLLFKRYAKFCIVGGTGVMVDMGIIWLLASSSMLRWNLSLSKVIAAEVAIFNNFIWNDVWTFRGLGAERTAGLQRLIRFLKFNLICLTGITLSVLFLNIQAFWLGINVYLANFISIVLVSIWNFFMNLRFGWSQPEHQPANATNIGP